MNPRLADAFDLVAHTEVLEQRLAAAVTELSKREALAEETLWLEASRRHITRAREGSGDLIKRALRLPELAPLRVERARTLQGAAVDAIEQLQVAIATAVGERSPMLEVLSHNLKIPAMRRAPREEFETFCAEIETRLASTYAKRMLADPSYEVVAPQLQQVHSAFAEWRGVFTSASDSEAQSLRDELEATARRLELPCRQARLLAEAAICAAEDLREASRIFERPKRRAARLARTELDCEADAAAPTETSEGEARTASPHEPSSDEKDDER